MKKFFMLNGKGFGVQPRGMRARVKLGEGKWLALDDKGTPLADPRVNRAFVFSGSPEAVQSQIDCVLAACGYLCGMDAAKAETIVLSA